MRKIRIKNLRKKKGSGELLGFCLMCPIFLYLFILFLQISTTIRAQQLAEHYAYIGARVAAVTDQTGQNTYEDRVDKAKTMADNVVAAGLDTDGYIQVANENGVTNSAKYWSSTLDVSMGGNNQDWVKGATAQYTITIYVPQFIQNQYMTAKSSICVMIESPLSSSADIRAQN